MQRVKEESQIIQTVSENRQAGTEACSHSLTFPAVEERRGEKKSPLSQELLSSKQGKMNSPLESSRTFLKPHLQGVLGLLLSIPSSSAQPFRGALAFRSGGTRPRDALLLAQTSPPAEPGDPSRSARREKVAPEQRLL